MAKITVSKSKNFSIVSNDILRDTNLSMKARFMLVYMLSLADTWEYSVAGLAKTIGCGKDAITSGIKELEEHGYLVRERVRDDKGRVQEMAYTIYEVPQNPVEVEPEKDSPETDNPELENPAQDIPTQGNQTQINTKYINNKYIYTATAREEDAAAVIKMFSDNIHPISGAIEQDKLFDLLERYGKDWVCSAITEAVECNGRNIRYIERILEAWDKRGKKGGGLHGNRSVSRGDRASETDAARAKGWDDEPDTL